MGLSNPRKGIVPPASRQNARVLELEYRHGREPCARKGLGVQLPPRAPEVKEHELRGWFRKVGRR